MNSDFPYLSNFQSLKLLFLGSQNWIENFGFETNLALKKPILHSLIQLCKIFGKEFKCTKSISAMQDCLKFKLIYSLI
jgi:hypothetical protein